MNESVLLIKPYSGLQVHDTSHPDIGLGYLAAALSRIDVRPVILDLHRERNWRAKLDLALKEDGLVAAGVKFYSKDVSHVSSLLSLARRTGPDLPLVGGGPHPSGDSGRVLSQLPQLEFAFRGEAETGLCRLVELIIRGYGPDGISSEELEGIPGLIFRRDGSVQINPPGTVMDLDALGRPAWELLRPERYHGKWISHGNYMPIMTSRGCSRSCSYCAGWTITGRKLRYRSLEGVIDEIDYLERRFGIRHFSVCDDNFTFDKDYVLGFCERIAGLNGGISWDCAQNAVRLDSLDPEIVTAMEKSGCKAVTIAAESGSERILKHMGKGFATDDVRRAVQIVRRHSKMHLEGYFIIGYPEEEREDALKSIDLSCELDLDGADFFIYTPHPGSPMYERLLREGRLGHMEWDKLLYSRATVGTVDMGPEEVEALKSYAYRRFYLRPRQLGRVGRKLVKMDRRLLYEMMFKAKTLMFS